MSVVYYPGDTDVSLSGYYFYDYLKVEVSEQTFGSLEMDIGGNPYYEQSLDYTGWVKITLPMGSFECKVFVALKLAQRYGLYGFPLYIGNQIENPNPINDALKKVTNSMTGGLFEVDLSQEMHAFANAILLHEGSKVYGDGMSSRVYTLGVTDTIGSI